MSGLHERLDRMGVPRRVDGDGRLDARLDYLEYGYQEAREIANDLAIELAHDLQSRVEGGEENARLSAAIARAVDHLERDNDPLTKRAAAALQALYDAQGREAES